MRQICQDRLECGHHVGWVRVVCAGAVSLQFLCMCQLDLATVSEFRSIREIQDTGHRTTSSEPGHFTDLTNSTPIEIWNCSIIETVSEEYSLDRWSDDKMAEFKAITITKFDVIHYKSWSLEIEILLEQKQGLRIVDG
jgi:hypothetical protein